MIFSRRRSGRRLWSLGLTLIVLALLLYTARDQLRGSSLSALATGGSAARDGGKDESEFEALGGAEGSVATEQQEKNGDATVDPIQQNLQESNGGFDDSVLGKSIAQPLSPIINGKTPLADLHPAEPPTHPPTEEVWVPPGFRDTRKTQSSPGRTRDEINAAVNVGISKTVVMGQLSSEDTLWVEEELPDWERAIYIVDLPPSSSSSSSSSYSSSEPFTLPPGIKAPAKGTHHTALNAAKEATPYLTHIVRNYPNFTDVTAFIHSHRKDLPLSWHTDARMNDARNMLQDLQLPTVIKRGYVNLRCITDSPGCPAEVQPFRDPPLPDKHAEHVFPLFYAELLNVSVGEVRRGEIEVVATPCCAQFAVSRAQILARPRADYERMLRFLARGDFDDAVAGRCMEYLWHILFGRDAVHCPDMFECYCEVYGRCRLNSGVKKKGGPGTLPRPGGLPAAGP